MTDQPTKPAPRLAIVTPEMLPGEEGSNINGPSLIRVPDWLPGRLGRYYLYFAHHRGSYIRLAYADRLEGPWHIHKHGVLPIAQVDCCRDHVASPDVHVDDDQREIRLYFHGVEHGGQRQLTFLARSQDGLNFSVGNRALSEFYLRTVPWRGQWIGMSKGGVMYVSRDGITDFKRLPKPAFPMRSPLGNSPGDVRHVALHCVDNRLLVYFSRIGDRPEHIRLGEIDLTEPPESWSVRNEQEVLTPQFEWEGADLPTIASRSGPAWNRENGLRDPAIYLENDITYLLYSFAGEQGIALTRVEMPAKRPEGIAQHLYLLGRQGALQERLAELDAAKPTNRIYLMGCGRSGTWLLTGMMYSYSDLAIVPRELSVEHFGLLGCEKPNLLMKRAWDSFETVESIPEDITIIYIVRHPYAVLTSHNPIVPREYYVTTGRWLGEIMALKYLLESGRPKVSVIRYEDLVTDPLGVQINISQSCNLAISMTPDEAAHKLESVPEAAKAMHGLRNIDRNSLNKFASDPIKIKYLKKITPRLSPLLEWASRTFDYDLNLP